MRNQLVALCLLFCSSMAFSQSLEFKGVPFGSTQEDLKSKHPAFQCFPGNSDPRIAYCQLGREICLSRSFGCAQAEFDASTYAGEAVDRITIIFIENSLERFDVTFKPESYEPIKLAISQKFGKPKASVKRQASTVSGAKFMNEESMWKIKGANVLMYKYDDRITQGSVSIMSLKYGIFADKENSSKEDNRQKDM